MCKCTYTYTHIHTCAQNRRARLNATPSHLTTDEPPHNRRAILNATPIATHNRQARLNATLSAIPGATSRYDHIHTYAHTHTDVHTHTHIRIHLHTRTHTQLRKASLEFRVQDKPVFEVPFASISQTVVQGNVRALIPVKSAHSCLRMEPAPNPPPPRNMHQPARARNTRTRK